MDAPGSKTAQIDHRLKSPPASDARNIWGFVVEMTAIFEGATGSMLVWYWLHDIRVYNVTEFYSVFVPGWALMSIIFAVSSAREWRRSRRRALIEIVIGIILGVLYAGVLKLLSSHQ